MRISNACNYIKSSIHSIVKYKSLQLARENLSVILSSIDRNDYFETLNKHLKKNFHQPNLFIYENESTQHFPTHTREKTQSTKRVAATYIHTYKVKNKISIFDALINSGWNTGNNAFGNSIAKHVPINHIYSSIKEIDEHIDYINNNYDSLLITPANIIQNGTPEWLCEYYEKIQIPLIPMSIGLQATADISEISDPNTARLMRAIADRSFSIGTRCRYSADYLSKIGVKNVDVIGCPSFYLNPTTSKNPLLNADSDRVAVNFSTSSSARKHIEKVLEFISHNQADYISQDRFDYFHYLENPKWEKVFQTKNHIFFSVSNWIDFLKTFKFSFGCRLHGNILALNAGIPALFICPDLRVRGVAEYMKVPIRDLSYLSNGVPSEESLIETLNYDAYRKGFKNRYMEFLDFLKKHELPHFYPNESKLSQNNSSTERL